MISISLSVIAIIMALIIMYIFQLSISDLYSELKLINERLSEIEVIFTKPTYCPEVKYARLFGIQCDGPVKIVKDSLNRTILIIPRNLTSPVVQYFISKYRPDLTIHVPVEKVVLFSSTQVALIWRLSKEYKLDLLRKIVGIAWGGTYEWYFPEVKELISNGTIVDLGYADMPDYEKLITLRPDVVVIYTIPGYEASSKLLEKLDELDIPYLVDNEWMETTILGRFEWIKMLALLFGDEVEKKAVELFGRVERNIEELKVKMRNAVKVPNIAWFMIYRGIVYSPKANSYVHNLIKICNGKYMYANYSKIDLELVLSLADKTDILIYSSYLVDSINDILVEEPRLSILKAIKEGNVYAYRKSIWQLGYAYTEDLVKEVCYIIHPESFKTYKLKFFKKLS